MLKTMAVIPVHNEADHVEAVVRRTLVYLDRVLVVDDGSTDGTGQILDGLAAGGGGVEVLTHSVNRGYGRSLIDAFEHARREGVEVVVTLDADGQHEPQYIPWFLEEIARADIVSGSRYLVEFEDASAPPAERRGVNEIITRRLRREFGLRLTDAFCGFKGYRTEALERMRLDEDGYGMPLQLWVQSARLRLRIKEIPVKLIYHDISRSFGGNLDRMEERLRYYHEVIDRTRREFDPAGPLGNACRCGSVAEQE